MTRQFAQPLKSRRSTIDSFGKIPESLTEAERFFFRQPVRLAYNGSKGAAVGILTIQSGYREVPGHLHDDGLTIQRQRQGGQSCDCPPFQLWCIVRRQLLLPLHHTAIAGELTGIDQGKADHQTSQEHENRTGIHEEFPAHGQLDRMITGNFHEFQHNR